LYLAGDLEEQFKAKVEAKLVDSGENLVVLIPDGSGVFYHITPTSARTGWLVRMPSKPILI